MLLGFEYFEKERPSWHQLVFAAGIACIVLGVLVRLVRNATGAIVRRRCVRCGHKVLRGQVYCVDHFHESISELRENQRDHRR